MFIEKIDKSVRLVTGKNYRNIMLLAECGTLEEVNKGCLKRITYFPLEEDQWKVHFIGELIDAIHDQLYIPGVEKEELHLLLEDLCTS